MLQRFLVVGVLGFLLAITSAARCLGFQDDEATPAPVIEEGVAFPDLLFPSLEDGTARSIRDFRGEKLILHIFASW